MLLFAPALHPKTAQVSESATANWILAAAEAPQSSSGVHMPTGMVEDGTITGVVMGHLIARNRPLSKQQSSHDNSFSLHRC